MSLRRFTKSVNPINLVIGCAFALFLGGCGKSNPTPSPSPNPPPGGGSVTIVSGASTLTNTAYNPNPVNITKGTTVTWTNSDSTTHTATSDNGMFDTNNISAGANSTSVTFSSVGTFSYHCRIHPKMVGTVNVQ